MEAMPAQVGEDKAESPKGGTTEVAVKEEIDWDGRDDEAAVTPPYLDDDAQHTGGWQDIPGREGTKQPVTPELLVDFEESPGDQQPSADAIVEEVKHKWPTAATFATIFHNMTMADIRREWGSFDSRTGGTGGAISEYHWSKLGERTVPGPRRPRETGDG